MIIKKNKMFSTEQIVMYSIYILILICITIFLVAKRNANFREIDYKIESIVSRYGYIKVDGLSNKKYLYYKSGEDSEIKINLEYDVNNYIIESCDIEYDNYDNSSFKIDYLYRMVNSILPDSNIYDYEEEVEYAINNKLYEEDRIYKIRMNTEKYKYGYTTIYDNTSNCTNHNYSISIDYY